MRNKNILKFFLCKCNTGDLSSLANTSLLRESHEATEYKPIITWFFNLRPTLFYIVANHTIKNTTFKLKLKY